jgi:hypothetical protein
MITISLAWHRRFDADPAHRFLREALRASFLDALAQVPRRSRAQATKR